MIVSFEHAFIFLKTRKTGGTSVEIALTPWCGAEDILTPISVEDEVARMLEGAVQARNYSTDPTLETAFTRAVLARDGPGGTAIVGMLMRRGDFYNHVPAATVQAKLPRDFWNKAFKFTIERHPYEKVFSRAYFEMSKVGASPTELESFVWRAIDAGIIDDTGIYTIDGAIVVDELMRQENIEEDFQRIASRLGLAKPKSLPKAKSISRPDRRPAREFLSLEQRRSIFRQCERTFGLLGYEA